MNNQVEHPSHYNQGMECWDEMELAFGLEATFHFAICNAWKYRKRAPWKGAQNLDMEKADEYMKKAKELKERMDNEKARQGQILFRHSIGGE